jgi:hypothetical protein
LPPAKIHLTDEIYSMQEELHERIKFTNLVLRKYKLPVIAENDSGCFLHRCSPAQKLDTIWFVACWTQATMLTSAFSRGSYEEHRYQVYRLPGFTTFSQIEQMIRDRWQKNCRKPVKEEGIIYEDIYKAFKMPLPEENAIDKEVASVISQACLLKFIIIKPFMM